MNFVLQGVACWFHMPPEEPFAPVLTPSDYSLLVVVVFFFFLCFLPILHQRNLSIVWKQCFGPVVPPHLSSTSPGFGSPFQDCSPLPPIICLLWWVWSRTLSVWGVRQFKKLILPPPLFPDSSQRSPHFLLGGVRRWGFAAPLPKNTFLIGLPLFF